MFREAFAGPLGQLKGLSVSILIYGAVFLIVFWVVRRIAIYFFGWPRHRANALGKLAALPVAVLATAPYFMANVIP